MRELLKLRKKKFSIIKKAQSETPTIYLLSEEIEKGILQGGFSQIKLNGQELRKEGEQVIQEIIYRKSESNIFKEEVFKEDEDDNQHSNINRFFGTQ